MTSPSDVESPPDPTIRTIQVTGTVSNHLGGPLEGVSVQVFTQTGGQPSAKTDVTGRYAIDITVNRADGYFRFDVSADGKTYDRFRQLRPMGPPLLPATVPVPPQQFIWNFTLVPIKHVEAGDTASLVLGGGTCWVFEGLYCSRVWVHTPADGNLTLEIDPGYRANISLAGKSGNPVTVPVTRGTEVLAEIELPDGENEFTIVKTSLQPF